MSCSSTAEEAWRRISEGEEVSDDPTSSSENESLSDSDDEFPATRTISQAQAPSISATPSESVNLTKKGSVAGQPRKVVKACQALQEAWRHVDSIVKGTMTGEGPWEGLLRAISYIFNISKDEDVKFQQLHRLQHLAKVLWCTIHVHVMPIIKTSESYRCYSKSLSRSESQALTRFVKLWSTVSTEVPKLSQHVEEQIKSSRCDILRRVAYWSSFECYSGRTRRPTLDLSDLNMGEHSMKDSDSIPSALSVFRVDTREVTMLDLSRNDLNECPTWLFGVTPDPMPFPFLCHLFLCDNQRLSSLPVRMIKTCLVQLLLDGTQVAQRASIGGRGWSAKRKVAPSYPSTLVHACIARIVRLGFSLKPDDQMAPHLSMMLRGSYMCDVCHMVCIPGSPRWSRSHSLENEPITAIPLGEGGSTEYRLKGRLCAACLQ